MINWMLHKQLRSPNYISTILYSNNYHLLPIYLLRNHLYKITFTLNIILGRRNEQEQFET